MSSTVRSEDLPKSGPQSTSGGAAGPIDPSRLPRAPQLLVVPPGVEPSVPAGVQPSVPTGVQPSVSVGVQPSAPAGVRPSVSVGAQPSVSAGVRPSVSVGVQPSVPAGVKSSVPRDVRPSVPTDMLLSPERRSAGELWRLLAQPTPPQQNAPSSSVASDAPVLAPDVPLIVPPPTRARST